MNNDLISIIVPVFNCEKYIEDCLDSIINQTNKNIEIILVNDGSTDSSERICREYQKKDNRIKIINQKNKGAAAARNNGLDNVNGNYIMFVDSDDVLNQNIVDYLLNLLKMHNADIALCRNMEFLDNIDNYNESNKYYVLNNIEAVKKLNNSNDITLALWGKLYKKELFYDKRLPLIKTSEDNLITYKLFTESKIIVASENQYYYNRKNEGSLTRNTSYFDLNLLYEGIKVIEYVKSTIPSEYENAIYKYLILTIGIYNTMIRRNIKNKESVKIIKKQAKEWYFNIKKRVSIPIARRLEIILFLKSTNLYTILYKLIK